MGVPVRFAVLLLSAMGMTSERTGLITSVLEKEPPLQRLLHATLAALLLCGTTTASAQQSALQLFESHNSAVTAVQPSFTTTLVAADPRLIQYWRLSVSHAYTAASTETVSYGNGKGGGIIVFNRLQLDFSPPAYIQHNQSGAEDGFGDASGLIKCRIVSGNSEHGNYIVTAILGHSFASGSFKNGSATDSFSPTIAAAKGIGKRVAVESTLGGTLPTGKIALQGRSIAWNMQAQAHTSPHLWLAVENNSTFYRGGSHDGKMQNFVTPSAFYVVRKKDWERKHPFWVFDGGIQIATSAFHTYNHNLISEVRVLF